MKKAHGDEQSTRQRILGTTVKLLYAAAPSELTTRRIAQEAEVNIAAINYHFRSKEELIDEAVQAATASAFDTGMKLLMTENRPAAERLREFFQGYATGLVRIPGLTRTAWHALILSEDAETVYGRYMAELMRKVGQLVDEIRGQPAGSTDGVASTLMILSCVVFPFLADRAVKASGALDYADDAARTRYIDRALAALVKSERPD